MSIFRPTQDRNNRFTPRLEALEDRRLCTIFIIPHGPPTPPRTGGAAALVGSVLLVVTNKPGANQAVIQDDGAGDVTVEWNGHTPPTFHGVTRIVLDGRGRRNDFTYTLTGNVTLAHEVDVRLDGTNSTFIPNLGAFQTNGLTFKLETGPAPANLAKGP
jgi:hypothetical protein